MPQLTWEEVLARDDLIGGDLETQERGLVYRGPIQKIHNEKMSVVFQLEWTAQMDPRKGGWDVCKNMLVSAHKEMSLPQDIGESRIFFEMPYIGSATIFPRGTSKLDPAKVAGLIV